MTTVTIGILGGMGPRATVEFERKLLDGLSGNDQELPSVVSVNNGNIPDRTKFLLGFGEDPHEALVASAEILAPLSPDIVCLPCNTAHADEILLPLLDEVDLPIIDMPAVCMNAVREKGVKKVLILGTVGTKQARVYEKRAGDLEVIQVNSVDQVIINQTISAIKRGREIDPAMLHNIVQIMKRSTCDVVILACTELALIKKQLEQRAESVLVMDSLDELASFCVKTYTMIKEINHDTRQAHDC